MSRRFSNQPPGQSGPTNSPTGNAAPSGRDVSPKRPHSTGRLGEASLPPAVCVLLATVTLAVFWPVTGFDFVNLDDTSHVTENAQVQGGLSWAGLGWALTNLDIGLWHPLTWISHMLDCQWFGLRPGGHHLSSLLLHVANTLLLFLGLRRFTGVLWRPALVAALFALHPLHVESVAWVAERKDVLSTFFFLLALGAYGRYAEIRSSNSGIRKAPFHPPSSIFYALSLCLFALALMSKPMFITLPLILLLLDYWPLRRALSALSSQPSTIWPLLIEKLPFAMAALVTGFLTMEVGARQSSLPSAMQCPLPARLANATLSYARYFLQTFWPGGLAVFYPFPATFSTLTVACAALLVAVISVTALWLARSRPYVVVGWLWYLVMLLPVIGLIQLGGYSHADRYTYAPLIGIFVLLAWGACDLTRHWRYQTAIASAAGTAAILLCLGLTHRQLGCWKNSEALFGHALACTSGNFVAHQCLGLASAAQGNWTQASRHFELALEANPGWAEARYGLGWVAAAQGNWNDAIRQYELALESNPRLVKVHGNLALALAAQGKWPEAIPHCELALQANPGLAEVHNCLGLALTAQGNRAEAMQHFEQAVQLKPGFDQAHANLAAALLAQGRWDEAVQQGNLALQANPSLAEARFNVAKALSAQGKWREAIPYFEQALKADPQSARTHNNLAFALARTGEWAGALVHFEQALAIQPEAIAFRNNLARLLATCPQAALRNGVQAVALALEVHQVSGGTNALYLDTLAAAHAEAGQFPQAVQVAERALALAEAQGNSQVEEMRSRLKSYRAGSAYHEPAPGTANSSP
jgi:protein O-mannosyl-transferase